jgi:hypothetical protein
MMYEVQQGDHVVDISERFGFLDYHTVWDDPNNADLKSKRNPNVLFPGDQLFIPDKQTKTESRATGNTYVFQIPVEQLKLRIALRDFDNQPIANTACQLVAGDKTFDLMSDGDGKIEQTIPSTLKTATLLVPDLNLEMEVKVGNLDPIDQDSGWMARLTNLGYLDPYINPDDDMVSWAIQEFQCDNKLTVNGTMDDATRGQLQSIYGC